MILRKWRVALVGFGRMAEGYSTDLAMAKYYKFATHAQVLRSHSRLDWQAVVDSDTAVLEGARSRWGVPLAVTSVKELGASASEVDVVVLATPPSARQGILSGLPNLRAILVEKPLGENLLSATQFLTDCRNRNLLVQVNFWRRTDSFFRELAEGRLETMIGKPMAVTCFYGNGLLNNGSHMVDMARMLFGEVEGIQVIDPGNLLINGPILGDTNPSFALRMKTGLIVFFAPIDFRQYRENGMIIWGTVGKIDILNEGLVIRSYPAVPNRAMSGEREIANDAADVVPSTVGEALYCMYENLIEALDYNDSGILQSSGSSAMASARLVDAIAQAAAGCDVKASSNA